jgi:hypothetical protein
LWRMLVARGRAWTYNRSMRHEREDLADIVAVLGVANTSGKSRGALRLFIRVALT